jgi:hypothetical protein
MKFTLTKSKTFLAITLCAGLLAMQTNVWANNGEEDPVKNAKTKKEKSFSSLNNQSVKIYPDAFNKDMHVVAKENENKEIDFFVFDTQGNLLYNYKMMNKDHFKISGLARGTYIYRVFNGDVETAAGKFAIK